MNALLIEDPRTAFGFESWLWQCLVCGKLANHGLLSVGAIAGVRSHLRSMHGIRDLDARITPRLDCSQVIEA